MQKRSAWKDSNPGCYDISSAGHLSAGDTYLEGALREIGEELGIHAEAEGLRDLGLLEKVSHGVFYGKPFHDHEVRQRSGRALYSAESTRKYSCSQPKLV